MKVLYERVAGIDVHKDMVKVAIRSPGEKPWTRGRERHPNLTNLTARPGDSPIPDLRYGILGCARQPRRGTSGGSMNGNPDRRVARHADIL